MSFSKFGLIAVLGAALLSLAVGLPSARAQSPLGPGGIGSGGYEATPAGITGGTLQAFNTQSFTTPGGMTGTLTEAVVKDSVTHDLDFLYQWTASSANTDTFENTSDLHFAGYTISDASPLDTGPGTLPSYLTSVGFVSTPGTVATVQGISRAGGPGDTVTWTYQATSLSPSDFTPGAITPVELIATNATAWGYGVSGILDGSTVNITTFEPVPEPAVSSGLAGLAAMGGLGGLGLVWRRRKRQVATGQTRILTWGIQSGCLEHLADGVCEFDWIDRRLASPLAFFRAGMPLALRGGLRERHRGISGTKAWPL